MTGTNTVDRSRIRSALVITALLVATAVGVALGGPAIVAAEEDASSDGELSVETSWWDTFGETSVLVEANLTDAGDADVADVWIEYREEGTDEWQTTAAEPGQAPQTVVFEIDDLEPATVYEYRAVAETATESDRGERRTFETWWNGPDVTLEEPVTVGEETATVVATVEDVIDGETAEVSFAYEPADSDEFIWNWEETPAQTVDADGTLTHNVTDLDPGTEYQVGAIVRTDWGSEYWDEDVVTFETDVPLTVETGDATAVSATEATLTGTVAGAQATAGFEYRPVDADDWQSTAATKPDSTGTVAVDVTDLEPGTEYAYRLVAETADGERETGSVESFETSVDPVVETGAASDVDEASVTVSGELVDLGGADEAAVAIQYRAAGDWTWAETGEETRSAPGAFEASLSGLEPETDYEYRAVVRADGVVATGAVETFTTEADEAEPTVERLAGSEDSPPNPHANLAVDWTVADEDGDLASVTVTIRNGAGAVVEWNTESVAGDEARGSLSTRVKHGAGDTYEVTLEVADDAGNVVTERAAIRA